MLGIALLASLGAPGGSAAESPNQASAGAFVSWHLVGTGPDGRSVLIHQLRQGSCGFDAPLTPTVVQASADRITLQVDEAPPSVDQESSSSALAPPACPPVSYRAAITSVPIGRRVAGQTITGIGRVIPPEGWDGNTAEDKIAAPSLVGLRIPDAVAVLRDLRIEKKRIHFKGPRRGHVIGQTPRAAATLKPNDSILLRTRP